MFSKRNYSDTKARSPNYHGINYSAARLGNPSIIVRFYPETNRNLHLPLLTRVHLETTLLPEDLFRRLYALTKISHYICASAS